MNQIIEIVACVYCISEIENNSFYCDQCGKEMFICESCGQFGQGNWCEQDGGTLKSNKESLETKKETEEQKCSSEFVNPISEEAVSDNKSLEFDRPVVNQTNVDYKTPETPLPPIKIYDDPQKVDVELLLINKSLGKSISIQPNTILGRTTGDYIPHFEKEKTVSGRHLQFLYTHESGWSVRDLGSTNQTKLAHDINQWRSIDPLIPNKNYVIAPYRYLLIADLEFMIEMSNTNVNKTMRV